MLLECADRERLITGLEFFADGREIADEQMESLLIGAAQRIADRQMLDSEVLSSPSAVRRFLSLHYAGLEREVFVCVWLNGQNRVIAWDEVHQGTLLQCSVYPREIARLALKRNAASVILSHNHPSGAPAPSKADIFLTKGIMEILALIDVKVFDHMVVSGTQIASFAELGIPPIGKEFAKPVASLYGASRRYKARARFVAASGRRRKIVA